jgi:hypothetical protein
MSIEFSGNSGPYGLPVLAQLRHLDLDFESALLSDRGVSD